MADDYLWDRSGPVDPDVEALERLLTPYATGRPTAPLPRMAHDPARPAAVSPGAPASWPAAVLATAAVLLLAVGATWLGPTSPLQDVGPGSAWQLSPLRGRPQVASRAVDGPRRVPTGAWIDTDSRTSARLDLGDAGRVIIAPESRVRIDRARPTAQHLHLEHGTIDALVWAPPGQVVVSTPVTTAVDLGCAYTLTLDRAGEGRLRVTSGWVGLVHEGREAFVPAGATVGIHAATGPGTPVLTAAHDHVKEAVGDFDVSVQPSDRQAALTRILGAVSPGDALTLWHLLTRVTDDDRAKVFDTLATLVSPPEGVTRAGVVAGDRAMIDAWWAALGYGNREWWQLWIREWRAPS